MMDIWEKVVSPVFAIFVLILMGCFAIGFIAKLLWMINDDYDITGTIREKIDDWKARKKKRYS